MANFVPPCKWCKAGQLVCVGVAGVDKQPNSVFLWSIFFIYSLSVVRIEIGKKIYTFHH